MSPLSSVGGAASFRVSGRRRFDWGETGFGALLALPFLWLLAFFFVPLGFVFLLGFSETENIIDLKLTWTLSNYSKAFEGIYLGIYLKSAVLASLTLALCMGFGFPIALFAASLRSPSKRFFCLFLLVLPFGVNMLIRTYALIALLRVNGLFNDVLAFFHEGLRGAVNGLTAAETLPPFVRPDWLYGDFAVIFGMAYLYLPFAVLPLYGSLAKMDRSIVESSFDLGAGKTATVFRVVLPACSEGILVASLIVFVAAFGSFLTPDLLGGPDSQMVANLTERQFKSANDWPFGAALSSLLTYLLFFFLIVKSLLGRRT